MAEQNEQTTVADPSPADVALKNREALVERGIVDDNLFANQEQASIPLAPEPEAPSEAEQVIKPIEGLEQSEPIPPATVESQKETETAITKKNEIFPKERIENLMKQGFSQGQAQAYILQELDRKDELSSEMQLEEKKEQEQELQAQKVELQQQAQALQLGIQNAIKRGLDPSSMEAELADLDAQIIQLDEALPTKTVKDQADAILDSPGTSEEQKNEAAEGRILADQFEKESEAAARDAADIEAQREQEREVLKSAIAKDQATRDTIEAEQLKALEQQKAAEAEMLRLADEAKKIVTPRSPSVMEGLGMILAGAGSGLTGQRNSAIDIVQKKIENEVNAITSSRKEQLAYYQQYYTSVANRVKALGDITNNRLNKRKLQIQEGQLMMEAQKYQQEMMKELQKDNLASKLSSPEGITPEEFNNIRLMKGVDEDIKKSFIQFADGKLRAAASASAATELRTKVLPPLSSVLRDAKRLKEIGETEFLGGAIDILDTKPEAKLLAQNILGNMRLEMFGPGVLTDSERKIAEGVLGNSAKIKSLRNAELKKLTTLIGKVRYGIMSKLELNGVPVPEDKSYQVNKQNVKKLIKASNGKMKEAEAIDLLRKQNKWQFDERADMLMGF